MRCEIGRWRPEGISKPDPKKARSGEKARGCEDVRQRERGGSVGARERERVGSEEGERDRERRWSGGDMKVGREE